MNIRLETMVFRPRTHSELPLSALPARAASASWEFDLDRLPPDTDHWEGT